MKIEDRNAAEYLEVARAEELALEGVADLGEVGEGLGVVGRHDGDGEDEGF